MAFDTIVATGPNAALPHARPSDTAVAPGDTLIVELGCVVDGYCSDITRTYPVSGRFSDRQRDVYAAVLRAQEAAIAVCRPGATLSDVHRAAWGSLDGDGLAEKPHAPKCARECGTSATAG